MGRMHQSHTMGLLALWGPCGVLPSALLKAPWSCPRCVEAASLLWSQLWSQSVTTCSLEWVAERPGPLLASVHHLTCQAPVSLPDSPSPEKHGCMLAASGPHPRARGSSWWR